MLSRKESLDFRGNTVGNAGQLYQSNGDMTLNLTPPTANDTNLTESDEKNPIRLNLPKKNDNFVVREECLSELGNAFKSKQIHTLYGLGGNGKTQLANHFLLEHIEHYQIIAKISAANIKCLQDDLIKLGRKIPNLKLPKSNKEQRAKCVVRYLSDDFNGHLFLFYDNAGSLEEINSYIPTNTSQHILITSINGNGWSSKQKIPSMGAEESIALLEKFIPDEKQDIDQDALIKFVKNTLGGMPLAIVQAGTYIRDISKSISEYLLEYETRKQTLLESVVSACSEHVPVYITFDMSITYLSQKNRNALKILDICTYCCADNIPIWFIKAATSIDTVEIFNDCKANISRFSLLDFNADSVSMHRVLQEIRRINHVNQKSTETLQLLVDWMKLAENFRYDYEHGHFRRNQGFIVHADSIIDYVVNNIKEIAIPLEVLYTIGMFYLDYRYNADMAKKYLALVYNRMSEANNKNLKAKICRQYAKAISRINPESPDILKLFSESCKFDPRMEKNISVDELKIELQEIMSNHHSTMRTKINSLTGLVKKYDRLIDSNEWGSLLDYLKYNQLKAYLSLDNFYDILIDAKTDDIAKLEKWKTDVKKEHEKENSSFEQKLSDVRRQINDIKDFLRGNSLYFPEKINVLIQFQLAKVDFKQKKYIPALGNIKISWELRNHIGDENTRLRILLLYSKLLVHNNKREEAKRLLKDEDMQSEFKDDNNRTQVKKKLKEISSQRSIGSFFSSSKSSNKSGAKSEKKRSKSDGNIASPKRQKLG